MPSKTPSQWVTIADLATLLGVSRQRADRVLVAAQDRGEIAETEIMRLPSIRLISRAAADRLVRQPRKAGRPWSKKVKAE